MYNGKITLTPDQEAYLVRHYKNTKNDALMEKLGLKFSTFHRIVRSLGLKKTKQFMKKVQRATADAAKASHLKNGTYPPKGYRIPRSEEFQYKPGDTPWSKCGRRKWNAAHKRGVEKRKMTVQVERVRVKWGFAPQTKLRVIAQPRQKLLDRCYLKRRGYILDEKNCIAYWTEDTQRATRLEAQPRRFYIFKSKTDIVALVNHTTIT